MADRKASGYTGNDDADLINIISSIDDADIAIIFVEQNENNTKISWRGLKPDIDVSRLPANSVAEATKPPPVQKFPAAWTRFAKRVLECHSQGITIAYIMR